ncbi:MAG: sugar phosphate isomerase/epimerase family protein [Candidatus Thermoplasmatota archaeon]|jgi:sugar phosphate isomerase/epimerase|nr:sugar phosphate isomerase/epimerase family protein [Candidatus Thermoplasmatota archaeon]MDP7265594.1 sugar phosphate isomerase/epimerase family protein [Candidatus Thermoplasmatota archaeon]
MEIGISSPYFCTTPFEVMLKKIAPHFEVWELIGEYEHYLPKIADRISDLKDSYNVELQLHLPFSDINPASVIPEARQLALDRLLASIDSAADVGISSVTLHSGSLSSITWRDRKWALKVARSSMEEIYERLVDCDMHMNLENLPYGKWMLGNTLEELEFLSEGFDEKVWGICYDIGHGFISGQQENFLANPSLISNIHAHDNHGTEDSHLIPGNGNIDFPKVAEAMRRSKSKVVIFEANSLEEGIKGKRIVEDYFG